jgi:hypothetical protein
MERKLIQMRAAQPVFYFQTGDGQLSAPQFQPSGNAPELKLQQQNSQIFVPTGVTANEFNPFGFSM